MKAIGAKCGWVVPRKERRVLKLLRNHTRECDHDFVTKARVDPRLKPGPKIHVEFAKEELSAFQPVVHILSQPDVLAA